MQAFQIPLSQSLICQDAFSFVQSQPEGFCDHIITDPDQANLEDISKLIDFVPLAFRAIAPKGFFGFFCPFLFIPKLTIACKSSGFVVQPFPLTWTKSDALHFRNPRSSTFFTQSVEFFLLCHKPGSILAKQIGQSDYRSNCKLPIERYHSPFAKPISFWRWIYLGIAIPDQIVYDPFCGAGTSIIGAIDSKLRPAATESNPEQFALLTSNVQKHFRQKLGDNLIFT